MKFLLIGIPAMLLSLGLCAQFTDSFSDPDLGSNPQWLGDTADFVVDSSHALRLMAAPQSNVKYLSTESVAIGEGEWEFRIRMDFRPSSSNYAEFHAVGDRSDLTGNANGYVIRMGGSERDLRLYRVLNDKRELLIDGPDELLGTEPVDMRIRLERVDSAVWQLWADSGAEWMLQGVAVDTLVLRSNYCGLLCKYSSSRSDKFYFDDIRVEGFAFRDSLPPRVDSLQISTAGLLQIRFSEAVIDSLIELRSDGELPDSITFDSTSGMYSFHFSEFPRNDSIRFGLAGVSDDAGNVMSDSMFTSWFYGPETGHLRINELLADPSSGGFDYLEFCNTSSFDIPLNGLEILEEDPWDRTDIVDELRLDETAGLIPANACRVICADRHWLARNYLVLDSASVIEADLPNFPDDLAGIRLQMESVELDRLGYSEDWHFSLLSNTEGVSLERLSLQMPTNDSLNWHSASTAAGYGTPGYENSQFRNPADGPKAAFSLDPVVFSPDHDGLDDLCYFRLSGFEPGGVLNIRIYDLDGRLQRRLVERQLGSPEAQYAWDGLDDAGIRCPRGIYLVFLEVRSEAGVAKNFRKRLVLGGRF